MKKSNCFFKKITFRIFIILFCLAFNCHLQARENDPEKHPKGIDDGYSESRQGQKLIQSTNPEQRLKWYEEHVALKEGSIFKDLEWRFIGPDIISGRVPDVAVHKDNRHIIYVASPSGGVWKTVPGGEYDYIAVDPTI